MPERREYTAQDNWDAVLAHTDGRCAVGLWSRYAVSTDAEGRTIAKEDPDSCFRAIRRFSRDGDGSSITQTHVYEKALGEDETSAAREQLDGVVHRKWIMERDVCSRSDGLINAWAAGSLRHRLIMCRTFPERGLTLSFCSALNLPEAGGESLPEEFFGEVDLTGGGGMIGVSYMYTKKSAEDGEAYALTACGEMQEQDGSGDLLTRDVDFDDLNYRHIAGRLPRNPADWLPGVGWSGRKVSLEFEDGKMWINEGEAVWRAPDAADISKVLVLTGAWSYFWGPREFLPVGKSERRQEFGGKSEGLVFEAGKRVAATLFQRVVCRYSEGGSCVRIDHEMYTKAGR